MHGCIADLGHRIIGYVICKRIPPSKDEFVKNCSIPLLLDACMELDVQTFWKTGLPGTTSSLTSERITSLGKWMNTFQARRVVALYISIFNNTSLHYFIMGKLLNLNPSSTNIFHVSERKVNPSCDQLCQHMLDLLAELLLAHKQAAQTEKKLTVESFAASVRSLGKLSMSAKKSDLRYSIAQHSKQGQSPDASVANITEAGEKLLKVADASERKTLQVAWLKLLLGSGKLAEIQALDAAVLSAFDMPAGQLWRSVTAAREAGGEMAKFEEILARDPAQHGPIKKDEAKDMMTHFLQVFYLNAEEMGGLGLGQVSEHQDASRKQMDRLIRNVSGAIAKTKQDLKAGVTRFGSIVPIVNAWDEAGIDRFMGDIQSEEDVFAKLMGGTIDSRSAIIFFGSRFQLQVGITAQGVGFW